MIGTPRTTREAFYASETYWLDQLGERITDYWESDPVSGTTVRGWFPRPVGRQTMIILDDSGWTYGTRYTIWSGRVSVTWPSCEGRAYWRNPTEGSPYRVWNLYALLAKFSRPALHLARIGLYGYRHPEPKGYKVVPMPWNAIYAAGILLEKGSGPPTLEVAEFPEPVTWTTGTPGRPWL